MRAETDVLVAGLGVLGAAAAASFARQGLSVVALDRHRPPHSLGSSHGGSRIIRRVYPEGALYVPLVERAYRLWRQLERRTGTRLLLPRGTLFLGDRSGEMVEAALTCARECGLEHELLAANELSGRFPALRAPQGVGAVLDPTAGILLPERCVEILLLEAVAAGAELRFDCGVEGWECTDEGVEVAWQSGGVRARYLILATGAWLADIAPALGMELTVERQVQHWFEPLSADSRSGDLPPFVWELAPGRTWYVLPDLGEGLKAALHRGGEATRADNVQREVDTAEVDEIRRILHQHLPEVAGACRRSVTCLYTNTPDQRFLVGPLPNQSRVWALGGGSGHGFKFAPALAELVAQGVMAGRPPAALAPFLPQRPISG